MLKLFKNITSFLTRDTISYFYLGETLQAITESH